MEQREFIVEAEAAGQRIDRFLSGEDTGLSRSALQGLVAEGHVLCNGTFWWTSCPAMRFTTPMVSPASLSSTVPTTSPC